jgi:hypothetical protein
MSKLLKFLFCINTEPFDDEKASLTEEEKNEYGKTEVTNIDNNQDAETQQRPQTTKMPAEHQPRTDAYQGVQLLGEDK